MANHGSYSRDGNHSGPFYASHASFSRPEPGQYGYSKGMGPPPMDLPPQPVEIDLHSRMLPNPSISPNWDPNLFSSPGLGDVHPAYGLSNIGKTQQSHTEHRVRGTGQDPILSWYTGNDGPWIPKGISAVNEEKVPNRHHSERVAVPFGGQYREGNPSENGTLQYGVPPSDSGYGTRRSVGTASIFAGDAAERETDCQSLTGHIGEYSPFQGLEPQETRGIDQWPHSVPALAGIPMPETNDLFCNTCSKHVKTRSELKKHHLRHTKPFTCDVTGCTRKDGFSTVNDLDRHRRSKHLELYPSIESKIFRCPVHGCKSKDKAWPRLDNFKSHVKRVHSIQDDTDLEEIVQKAEGHEHVSQSNKQDGFHPQEAAHDPSWQPAIPETQPTGWKPIENSDKASKTPIIDDSNSKEAILRGPIFARRPDPSKTVQPQDLYKARISLDNAQIAPVSFLNAVMGETAPEELKATKKIQPSEQKLSVGKDSTTDINHAALAGTGFIKATKADQSSHDQNRGSRSDSDVLRNPWTSESQSAVSDEDAETFSKVENHSGTESQEDIQEAIRILREKGYIVHDAVPTRVKVNAGSVASNKSEHQVTCSVCHKFKGRPCELKKHMKRHDRPYGCTFLTCNKSFGSKNDWKRHENSQHFQLETWRCQEEKPEGGPCAKVCYRRQAFKDHLSKEHCISDTDAITEKLEASRIGRNCQSRFWCGFCEKLVELKRKGLEAWTERFNHIDDHFMGRNGNPEQRISDWVPVDSDRPKGLKRVQPLCASSSEEEESSPSSASSNGSLPEVVRASSSEPPVKKRKASDDESGQYIKKSRPNDANLFTTCCQCDYPHLAKLHHSCTICNDGHRFCGNCKTTLLSAENISS